MHKLFNILLPPAIDDIDGPTPRFVTVTEDGPRETMAFGRRHVSEVLAWWDAHGDYAEREIACLVALTDGRWAAGEAACDTTGWDCQAHVTWTVSDDLQAVIKYGFTDEQRRNLGAELQKIDVAIAGLRDAEETLRDL